MTLPASDFSDPFVSIYHGDSWALAPMLDPQSINCIVTSPPYWGLRDYGESGQFGLESTPEEYVARLVDLFRLLRPALRDDGTVWLNLGDSYASAWACDRRNVVGQGSLEHGKREDRPNRLVGGLKEKDLVGIPWRVAFALQADGWWLRSDIIWHKPNPMPESVTDRCTKAHEYIFLLTKSARYWYDAEAVKETASYPNDGVRVATPKNAVLGLKPTRLYGETSNNGARNRHSVWTVATQPFSAAHFATFPPELIRPCILAGAPERCCPECGAPWERIVERVEGGDQSWSQAENPTWKRAALQNTTSSRLNRGSKELYAANRAVNITICQRPACTCGCSDTVPGTVLDPFMGSGTTAAVARKLGRRAVGFELNAEYIQIAAQHRLSDGMLL